MSIYNFLTSKAKFASRKQMSYSSVRQNSTSDMSRNIQTQRLLKSVSKGLMSWKAFMETISGFVIHFSQRITAFISKTTITYSLTSNMRHRISL